MYVWFPACQFSHYEKWKEPVTHNSIINVYTPAREMLQ